MSYQLKVIKDHPIVFLPLDESSGVTASDISGCGNNGTYVGGLQDKILPLVSGGVSGNLINSTKSITLSTTKDYYGSTVSGGFANRYTSKNNFTLEAWFYPQILSNTRTVLLADNTSLIGLYYEAGSIVFKLQAEELYYALNNTNKVMHIAASYSQNSISLYIDGAIVATKSISSFSFSNTTSTFSIGPTSGSDYFIVDAPAIYRNSLPLETIKGHFAAGAYHVNPIQFVRTDGGILFPLNDEFNKAIYRYSLKNLDTYVTDDVYYDKGTKSLVFYKTETVLAKTVTINDIINIPTILGATTSKIYWKADKNITVESSLDGINYLVCTNGLALPQYSKAAVITTNIIFIRITMSTTDASKYLPRLSSVKIDFYVSKNAYAENSGYYATSTSEYSLGSFSYPPLLRHKNNGLQTVAGSGFNIPVTNSVSSIEMIFTPSDLTANTLFDVALQGAYAASRYSWTTGGTITKTNISKIYINGVDRTTQTNISDVLVANNLHHVVIVLTQPASGTLKFNYSGSGGPSCLYKNIALYGYQISQALATEHYGFYIARPSAVISDTSITLTETTPVYYNNDWRVMQTI